MPPQEVFDFIYPDPIASASIGQVIAHEPMLLSVELVPSIRTCESRITPTEVLSLLMVHYLNGSGCCKNNSRAQARRVV